ncbi:hypothetical protein V8C44DRAFT_319186 [Trichoderma aethiopicum]
MILSFFPFLFPVFLFSYAGHPARLQEVYHARNPRGTIKRAGVLSVGVFVCAFSWRAIYVVWGSHEMGSIYRGRQHVARWRGAGCCCCCCRT